MDPRLSILVVSTPVGPLGSGLGGGVELTLINTTRALKAMGHSIQVIAPLGSTLPDVPVIPVPGDLQIPAQTQTRDTPITLTDDGVLAQMWRRVIELQDSVDIILNVAYDWLPFYLTPFLHKPVAHLVSMGSLSDELDGIMGRIAEQYPGSIGVYTQTQADTFPFGDRCVCLGSGLDLALYEFCATPDPSLCWLGRISPEKALEDALAVARTTGLPLQVMGKIQDEDYFAQLQVTYADAPFTYHGFLATQPMQAILRRTQALLVTSRWVEAFGNVLIEALACGVPVIAYRRGGPVEIVRHGETGWLVEPDSVAGLLKAVQSIDQLNRATCRQQAEADYSLAALGDRTLAWLQRCLADKT